MIQVILYANRRFSCWSLVFRKNFSCGLQHNEAFRVHELANPCRKCRALGLTSLLKGKYRRTLRPNGGNKTKWCSVVWC